MTCSKSSRCSAQEGPGGPSLSLLNLILRTWPGEVKPLFAVSEKPFHPLQGHWETKSEPGSSLSPEIPGDGRDSDLSDRSLSTPSASPYPTLPPVSRSNPSFITPEFESEARMRESHHYWVPPHHPSCP